MEKRNPLRKRVSRIFILLCALSVIVTAIVSIVGIQLNQSRGRTVLEAQSRQNLSGIVKDKADLANAEFGRFADYITFSADYIHQLYQNKEDYLRIGKEVLPPLAETPQGVYAMQRNFTTPEITYESVKDEVYLLSNLETVFSSIVEENQSTISTIYAATESGLMISYDPDSPLSVPEEGQTESYFNFQERPWYLQAKEAKGTIFTDVYTDGYGRGLNITCACAFTDADGNFAGVVAADYLITNLYDVVVEMNLGEGAYTFLVDHEGNLISPDKTDITLEEDPDLDDAARKMLLAGETGICLTDKDVYYAFTPVPIVNWELAVHMPKSLMLQPAQAMERGFLYLILSLSLIFLVILILVSILSRRFSSMLTAPILRLDQDVKEISNGHLDYRAKVEGNDEISDLAESFNNMTVSLQNHIHELTCVTAEQERIRAELDVAAQIQSDMLPSVFPAYPDHPEFDLYASMTPARQVGGDFYDFFLLDENHLALVIADVSGKGVPAALFMTKSCSLIREGAKQGGTAAEILRYANQKLCLENAAHLFVTVWLGILDLNTGVLDASNAGHEYPAVCSNGTFRLLDTENDPPLATEESLSFNSIRIQLKPGDAFFLYTDGLTDAKDANGRHYGRDRMLRMLNETDFRNSRELLESIKKDVSDFSGSGEPFDDITLLSLIYTGKE